MDISSPYPYLDEIVGRLQARISRQVRENIRTVDLAIAELMRKERERLGLGPDDDFSESYMDAFHEAFKQQAELLTGGWAAVDRANAATDAELRAPGAIGNLCRELVPACISYDESDWFAIHCRCGRELLRVLQDIVFTRLVYRDDPDDVGGFAKEVEKLRCLLT